MKRRRYLINLLPSSHTPPPAVSLDHLLLSALVLVVAVSLFLWTKHRREIGELSATLAKVQGELNNYRSQAAALASEISANAAKEEQQTLVRQIIGEKLRWAEVFKELSMVIPERTWLTRFSAENSQGRLIADIQGETASQSNMAEFFAALERSEYFDKMILLSSRMTEDSEPPIYQFQFSSPAMSVRSAKRSEP